MRLVIPLLLLFSTFPLYAQVGPPPRVRIVIQSLHITNDSSISSENLRRIESKLHDLGYPPDPGRFVQKIAKAELENNGYFGADVADAATEVVSETATKRYIAVTLRIREGEQYRLKEIKFENNKALSAAQLRQVFPINDGDVADGWKIEQGERAMRELYAREGYMQITAVVKNTLNDETRQSRTLIFRVDVQEGPQSTVAGVTLEDREWPRDKADKLLAIARQYQGSHSVGVFIDAVKQTVRDIFPGCDPDTVVGSLKAEILPTQPPISIGLRIFR